MWETDVTFGGGSTLIQINERVTFSLRVEILVSDQYEKQIFVQIKKIIIRPL